MENSLLHYKLLYFINSMALYSILPLHFFQLYSKSHCPAIFNVEEGGVIITHFSGAVPY